MDHEERVAQLEQELLDHRANPLPAKAKSILVDCYREKDAYLHFEVIGIHVYQPSNPVDGIDFSFVFTENSL